MKKLMFSILCAIVIAIFVLAANSHAGPNTGSKVNFTRLFIPDGFDSNDNIQVVGEGRLENSNQDVGDSFVQVDATNMTIQVGARINESSGTSSPHSVEFHRLIGLGSLTPGIWSLKNFGSQAVLGQIVVHMAPSTSQDDFSYAPTTQADYRVSSNSAELRVAGYFNDSCTSLNEVRLQMQGDVIVMQPIVIYQARSDCSIGRFAFSSWTAVDFLKSGRYLVHIRSEAGQALNALIDVP